MKDKLKRIIVVTILLIVFINFKNIEVYANRTYNFKNITVEQGLSQSTAETIIQDSDGYIWIGTNDGLNKYNGYNMKIYRHNNKDSNSLINSHILDLEEDNNKNLWIGTVNGVSKLNLMTDEITNYDDSKDGGDLSNYNTGDIIIRKNGDILVGTSNGLNLYNEKEDKFERILEDKLNNQVIHNLAEDNEGNLWVATQYGVDKVNIEKNTVNHYDIGRTNETNDKKINSIYFDRDGYIWAGGYNDGLYKINIKTDEIKKYQKEENNTNSIPSETIKDIKRDSLGNLWIGTEMGFALYRPESDDFEVFKNKSQDPSSVVGNNVYSIMEDRNGLLWIGTYTGISIVNPNNKIKYFGHDPFDNDSLSSSVVHGIYEDAKGVVWIGTNSDGLNVVNLEDKKNTKLTVDKKQISDDNIRDIVGIGDYIVVGTTKGLNIINRETKTNDIYTQKDGLLDNTITALFIDNQNHLWIGAPNGVSIMNLDSREIVDITHIIKRYMKDSMYVKSIYQDEKGYYWIGGFLDEGLLRLDPSNESSKLFKNSINDNKSISSNTIRTIKEDTQGNLWLGTSCGLNKFDYDTETFTSYTTEDGLSNNIVYGILFDKEDNPWMSTNIGINKFDIEKNQFEKFGITDGLQGNEYNGNAAYETKDGQFLFGGINGMNSFKPEDLNSDLSIEKVQFDGFEVKGNYYKDINNKKFNYSDNLINIKMFTPVFENNNIQYIYKLKGLDTDWNITNSNEVNYASLMPGDYEFLVKYRDDNGQISEESSMKFTIRPPFLLSETAIIIYILLFIIMVFRQLNRVQVLNKMVEEKTKELNQEMKKNNELLNKIIDVERIKNNYFVNLSHELRTPLNVMYTTEQLITTLNEKDKGINKSDVDRYMNVMNRNIKRLLNLINNIIDTSKIENGSYQLNIEEHNIVYVVEEAALSLSEYIKSKNIDLIIDTDTEEKIMNCDAYEIERCIVNLVSNAAKFTKEGGYIKVFIYDMKEEVKIVVEDNGIGISKENQDTVFDRFKQVIDKESEVKGGSGLGLSITKNIIKMHSGTITLESEIGKGCRFIILLPSINKTENQ